MRRKAKVKGWLFKRSNRHPDTKTKIVRFSIVLLVYYWIEINSLYLNGEPFIGKKSIVN
jgi:hypothetical protein